MLLVEALLFEKVKSFCRGITHGRQYKPKCIIDVMILTEISYDPYRRKM